MYPIVIENPEDKENHNIVNVKDEKDNAKHKTSLPDISKIYLDKVNSDKEEKSSKFLNSLTKKQRTTFITNHYSTKESENLLLSYGISFFNFNKHLDDTTNTIPKSLLYNHTITPNTRTKMVDWMVEVLKIYQTSEETYFLSVNIMDLYLTKCNIILKSENVHLIGVTSMFIASKFEEIVPITINQIVRNIAHNRFTNNKIKNYERRIINTISIDSLINTSIWEFLKTFFFDFYFNNNDSVNTPKLKIIFFNCKETALYLAKVILHFEEFYEYNNLIKAICCICIGKKIVKEKLGKWFDDEANDYYEEWVLFLIEENELDKGKIEEVCNKVYRAYLKYQKMTIIAKNLNKFCRLSYINSSYEEDDAF